MAKVIKVVVSGSDYNALTDTNPDHFALYVDQKTDHILIKEKNVDTVSVNANSSTTISHGLGYVPFCLVFLERSSGVWRKLFSRPVDLFVDCYFYIDNSNLTLYNYTNSAKNFSYHIFYDNIT
jgi:hypothetical protein